MENIKVLLCGAFGYGNIGDNLLRDTLIKMLSKTYPSLEIYIDQPHPNEDLINFVDLRIFGGGGLLYDNDNMHTEYMLKYAKPPYILFGVGVQFPESLKTGGLTKKLINGADFILLRSDGDLRFFTKTNTKAADINVLPDLVFFNKDLKCIAKSFVDKQNTVTLCPNVSLLDLKQKLRLCSYAEEGLIDNVISFSIEDDKFVDELSRYINPHRTTVDKYFDSYSYLYSVIHNSDLLITGRYHAGVFGLMSERTKVVSLQDKGGKIIYKLKTLIKDQVNWKNLAYNRGEYIKNIEKPKEIDGFNIENMQTDEINPVLTLQKYFDNFKKRGIE